MRELSVRRAALGSRVVESVLGEVSADSLGHTQLHEHLFCDLNAYGLASQPAEPLSLRTVYAARVDNSHPDDLRLDDLETAIDEVNSYRSAGGQTIVDATSRGLGREPARLREVARATGVNVVMGGGWYIDPFQKGRLHALSVEEIAADIVRDAEVGVDDVRLGIIGEIGVSWPPSVDEQKSLRAAAMAQQETGLAILLHPGRHELAPRVHLDTLVAAGADPTRVIVSHIDRTIFDVDDMQRLAEETGAVLEFDLFGDESSYYPPNPTIDRPNDGIRVQWVVELVRRGLVDHIAISQDICRKTRLTAWGGEGYGHIIRRVLPLMAARGLAADAIEVITQIRPAELLSRPVTETS